MAHHVHGKFKFKEQVPNWIEPDQLGTKVKSQSNMTNNNNYYYYYHHNVLIIIFGNEILIAEKIKSSVRNVWMVHSPQKN